MKQRLTNPVLALAALLAVFLLTSSQAFAGDNDFKLSRFCDGGDCSAGADAFKEFSKAYAAVFAPMHFQPAGSLGQEGFEITAEGKFSFALEKSIAWKALNKNDGAEPDADGKYEAPAFLAGAQLHVRKGLPFSLEIEGVFSWLANSELFFVGAGLKWSAIDGFNYLPDLSFRANVGTMVGTSELVMFDITLDATLSYTWNLAGVVGITPYAGYSCLISLASSRPIVVAISADETAESVFKLATEFQHHAFAGIELRGDYFIVGLEGSYATTNLVSAGVKIGTRF